MSQSKYNRLEKHPRTKQWEQTGTALLLPSEAETLNDSTRHTGVKFELVKKTKTTKK